MNLAILQRDLQHFILTGAPGVHALVRADTAQSAARRIAVYSHGYYSRLLEVLGKDYIGLAALLGEDAFETLGRQYIAAYPSIHYNARWVGQELPKFMAGIAAYRELPHAVDMAKLDWAITLAFDAVDAAPIDEGYFSQILPERWSELVFKFHPALQVFAISSNVLDMKRADERGEPMPPAEVLPAPQHVAVWRRDLRVFYRALPEDERSAICVAQNGADFGTLCEGLSRQHAEDAVGMRAAELLRTWLHEQWLIGCGVGACATQPSPFNSTK
ncbi:MAG: DUF2063 domain-containing protein [Gammaproteobacteria bacterium]|nr:DUF2063 domain-containing protein [Gammaproteobacteria bacterium]